MARPDRIGTAARTVRAALAVHAALAGAAVVGADPAAALPLGTPIVAVSTVAGMGAGRVRAEGSGPQGYRWGSGDASGSQGFQWGDSGAVDCPNPFGIDAYVGRSRGLGAQDYRSPGAPATVCAAGPQAFIDTVSPEADGAQGFQGAAGADGASGSDGTGGAAGVDGSSGQDGGSGVPGPAGAQGARGAQGAQGSGGAQGATGSGSRGATGAQGAPGAPVDR